MILSQVSATIASLTLAISQLTALLAVSPQEIVILPLQPETLVISEIYAKEGDIAEVIIQEATKYGVDPDLALFLADVESNLNPTAKNPNSSALGIFQFIDSTWKTYCEGERTDPRDNSACAMKLISKGGMGHWTADMNTRNKLIENGFLDANTK